MHEGASLLTMALVRKFPGAPDVKRTHPSSRSAAPLQRYAERRVLEVEQTVEWRQGPACAAMRSETGKSEAVYKAAELVAHANTLPSTVQLSARHEEAPDATS